MSGFTTKKGFSLVSVLVAAALIGMLAMVIGKLMDGSSRALQTTKVGLEALDYQALLEDTFRSRDACTNTFGQTPTREGVAASDSNNILATNTLNGQSGILNADGNAIWTQDEIVEGGLELKTLKILEDRVKPDGTTAANFVPISTTPVSKGFFQVQLLLEKTGTAKASYGGSTKLIKLSLTAEVYGPGNRIKSCQLSGTQVPEDSTSVDSLLFTTSSCSDAYEDVWTEFDLSTILPPEATKVKLFAVCGESIMSVRLKGNLDTPITSSQESSVELDKYACFAGNNNRSTHVLQVELNPDQTIEVHNNGTDCNSRFAYLKVTGWSQ